MTFKLSAKFGKRKSGVTYKSLDDSVEDDDIKSFLNKFIFAVHTPNEVQLGKILTKEVGAHYNLFESDFQSSYILEKMLDWFKKKDSEWYSSEKGKRMLEEGGQKMESLRVTYPSIKYQEQLNDIVEFNKDAIREIVVKLNSFLDNSNINQIATVTTSSPEFTTAKVIAAIKQCRNETSTNFQREDSFLITSSSQLRNDQDKVKRTMSTKHSHRLLVIVCEKADDSNRENDKYYFIFTSASFLLHQSVILAKRRKS